MDAATEAGKLLEDLPQIWHWAYMTERRKLLLTVLEAVYIETKEERLPAPPVKLPTSQRLGTILTSSIFSSSPHG